MNVFKDIERKGSDEVASAKIRVKQACEKLFEKVAARAQELCKAHQIDITTFILTIPPNWKIEVEEYYSSLIKKAFDPAQDVEILFVFEVEALARYLFHDDHACRTIVNDRLSAHRGCKFLIVDFGGFTFVSIPIIAFYFLLSRILSSPFSSADRVTPRTPRSTMLKRMPMEGCAFRPMGTPVVS